MRGQLPVQAGHAYSSRFAQMSDPVSRMFIQTTVATPVSLIEAWDVVESPSSPRARC